MTEKGRNPFRGFVDNISEANRMREHWMTGYDPTAEERTHATAWVPTTDIYANPEGDLVIRCELAGITRDDLDITFSNGVLTVSGRTPGSAGERDLLRPRAQLRTLSAQHDPARRRARKRRERRLRKRHVGGSNKGRRRTSRAEPHRDRNSLVESRTKREPGTISRLRLIPRFREPGSGPNPSPNPSVLLCSASRSAGLPRPVQVPCRRSEMR